MRAPLSEDAFCAAIADYFSLSDVNMGSRLQEDLKLDSLQLYELVLLLEDVADAEVPEGVVESMQTVGDVFDTYRLYSERQTANRSTP